MVGHSTASTAAIFVPWSFLSRSPAAIVPADPVAETNAATIVFMTPLEIVEYTVERVPGAVIMDKIIGKFGKLIENHVLLVALELCALVVNLLDVAFRTWRTNNVRRLSLIHI